MKVLVTGAAGFIGLAVCQKLLGRGDEVYGLDALKDAHDPEIKEARIRELKSYANFHFIQSDLCDREEAKRFFSKYKFDRIVHLAAIAMSRGPVDPFLYLNENVYTFASILEGCREHCIPLVYASTNLVYGINKELPFSEDDSSERPVSLYAATKKTDELFAHVYSHLYNVQTTGLRFFSVYGPWSRSNLAFYIFTKKALEGQPVTLFNNGLTRRDYIYVDDVAHAIALVIDQSSPDELYRVYNVGTGVSHSILDVVHMLENILQTKIAFNFAPGTQEDLQMPDAFADTSRFERDFNFTPAVTLKEGMERFVAWYRATGR